MMAPRDGAKLAANFAELPNTNSEIPAGVRFGVAPQSSTG
jgi:hypothetical protein